MSRSPAETMDFIKSMSDNTLLTEAMTNKELANALRDDVWAFCDMDSMESALIGEAFRRLGNLPTSIVTKDGGE